jgi:chaperonin GroEL (HSP60 family)
MAFTVKVSQPTARKVAFSQTQKPLTLKSSTSATKVAGLADVDTTEPGGTDTGATLIYDAATSTYKSEKVFDYIEATDQYKLDGGNF